MLGQHQVLPHVRGRHPFGEVVQARTAALPAEVPEDPARLAGVGRVAQRQLSEHGADVAATEGELTGDPLDLELGCGLRQDCVPGCQPLGHGRRGSTDSRTSSRRRPVSGRPASSSVGLAKRSRKRARPRSRRAVRRGAPSRRRAAAGSTAPPLAPRAGPADPVPVRSPGCRRPAARPARSRGTRRSRPRISRVRPPADQLNQRHRPEGSRRGDRTEPRSASAGCDGESDRTARVSTSTYALDLGVEGLHAREEVHDALSGAHRRLCEGCAAGSSSRQRRSGADGARALQWAPGSERQCRAECRRAGRLGRPGPATACTKSESSSMPAHISSRSLSKAESPKATRATRAGGRSILAAISSGLAPRRARADRRRVRAVGRTQPIRTPGCRRPRTWSRGGHGTVTTGHRTGRRSGCPARCRR